MIGKWIKIIDKFPPADKELLWRYETGEHALFTLEDIDELRIHDPPFSHWMEIPELEEDTMTPTNPPTPSQKYNALPFKTRKITGDVITQMRIQQLGFEKDRLIKRHRQSLREINAHIKRMEKSLKESCENA